MALGSFSLSLLMQVHEAAAVVESGGEAGDEWRPPSGSVGLLPCLPVKRATLTGVEARYGERLPNPAARRLLLVYSKSIYDLRTSTRAPHVSAAPVRPLVLCTCVILRENAGWSRKVESSRPGVTATALILHL